MQTRWSLPSSHWEYLLGLKTFPTLRLVAGEGEMPLPLTLWSFKCWSDSCPIPTKINVRVAYTLTLCKTTITKFFPQVGREADARTVFGGASLLLDELPRWSDWSYHDCLKAQINQIIIAQITHIIIAVISLSHVAVLSVTIIIKPHFDLLISSSSRAVCQRYNHLQKSGLSKSFIIHTQLHLSHVNLQIFIITTMTIYTIIILFFFLLSWPICKMWGSMTSLAARTPWLRTAKAWTSPVAGSKHASK